MARPRKHESAAEKQAAYRQRQREEAAKNEPPVQLPPEPEFDGWIDPQAGPPAHVTAVDEEAFSPESAEERQLRLQQEREAFVGEIESELSQQEIRNKYAYSTSEKRTKAQRDQAAARMVSRSRASLGEQEQEIQALWRRQAELMEHTQKEDPK